MEGRDAQEPEAGALPHPHPQAGSVPPQAPWPAGWRGHLSRSRSHGPHLDLQQQQAQRGGWGRERPQAWGGRSHHWGRAKRRGAAECLQTSLTGARHKSFPPPKQIDTTDVKAYTQKRAEEY